MRWYNKALLDNSILTRGCTGFDGGCAAMEAIGGSWPPNNGNNKYKRWRQFSIRCLVAAVGLRPPTVWDTGFDYVGNDIRKALRVWAYDEATETISLSLGGWQREW